MRLCVIAIVFLPSCSSIRMNVSTGLIDPAFGCTAVKDQSRQYSAMYSTVEVEGRLDTKHFAVTLSAGPAWTAPLDGKSDMFGAVVTNRIQWKMTKYIQPYFKHSHGFHSHTSRWDGISDVWYEFSTMGALGVAVPIDDRVTFTLDYGYTHFSNGKTIWSNEMRNWFNLTKAEDNWGVEAGMVSVGVSIKI